MSEGLSRIDANGGSEIFLEGRKVAVNSCDGCDGKEVCRRCKGAGSREFKSASSSVMVKCEKCRGGGKCLDCLGHGSMLRSFATELSKGSFGTAEACLQNALMRISDGAQNSLASSGVTGAGIGLLVGSIVAPGIGSMVGMSMGKMLGDSAGATSSAAEVRWRQADVLYCLGVLYAVQGRSAEASQAWIKSLSLNEKHSAAREALEGR